MNTKLLRGAGRALPAASRWLAAALLALALGPAFGQQVVDATFVASVDRPAFTDKRPRVLIDEAHFNVHTASGGYRPFADLITSDGCRVAPNSAKFSKESLQDCDVLVIANARGAAMRNDPNVDKPAFTDAECDAVRDWVQAGGALLFVADHWPIGAASECLAQRFGVDMSKGHTIDPANRDPGRQSMGSLSFTRENGLLGDHAITRGRDDSERVGRFATFTGQSLKGPEGSAVLLKLADTAYDEVPPDNRRVSAAGRAQGIAFTFGKGRVVVMGEAACLSAQTTGGGRMAMGAARGPMAPAGPMAAGPMAPGRGRMRMRANGQPAAISPAPAAADGAAAGNTQPAATASAPMAGARMGSGPMAMGMNAPGLDNRQMALNIVRWLAGLYD